LSNVPQILPYHATPAPQDSATQAWLFHPEVPGGNYGVAGDPMPYKLRNDDTFTCLLLLCIVIFFISVSNVRHFIVRQLKDFFYQPLNDTDITETAVELRFQLFLVLLTCLLMAIIAYQYTITFIASTFVLSDDFLLVGLLTLVFIGFYVCKALVCHFVNSVFFDHKSTTRWLKLQLFLTATTGVLFFPAVLLMVYFDTTLQNSAFYYAFVFIFIKILTFYKSRSIFFGRKGDYMQNILYFCTLEIVPFLILCSGLLVLIDHLKINY